MSDLSINAKPMGTILSAINVNMGHKLLGNQYQTNGHDLVSYQCQQGHKLFGNQHQTNGHDFVSCQCQQGHKLLSDQCQTNGHNLVSYQCQHGTQALKWSMPNQKTQSCQLSVSTGTEDTSSKKHEVFESPLSEFSILSSFIISFSSQLLFN